MRKPKLVSNSNTTDIMIVPMYSLPMSEYEKCGYIQGFINDDSKQYVQPVVVMVFESGEQYAEPFTDLCTVMDQYVVDIYPVEDKLVVMVLEIPEELVEDYHSIVESRYHELSEDYRYLVSDRPEIDRRGIGKRLPLLIAERDERVMKVMVDTAGGMNVHYDQVWKAYNVDEETLTADKINELLKSI